MNVCTINIIPQRLLRPGDALSRRVEWLVSLAPLQPVPAHSVAPCSAACTAQAQNLQPLLQHRLGLGKQSPVAWMFKYKRKMKSEIYTKHNRPWHLYINFTCMQMKQ